MISECYLDMSSVSNEIIDMLLPFIRHAKEEINVLAENVLRALVKQISDGDVLRMNFEKISELLEGKKEGKIKSVHEKNQLCHAIGILSTTQLKNQKLIQHVIEFCLNYYKIESNKTANLN